MTTIDPTCAGGTFEKLGITRQAGTQKAAKDTLGQSDFLVYDDATSNQAHLRPWTMVTTAQMAQF